MRAGKPCKATIYPQQPISLPVCENEATDLTQSGQRQLPKVLTNISDGQGKMGMHTSNMTPARAVCDIKSSKARKGPEIRLVVPAKPAKLRVRSAAARCAEDAA